MFFTIDFWHQAQRPDWSVVAYLVDRRACTNGSCDNTTPIPGAVWLFGTVLAGGAGFGRWRKKRKQAA